MLCATHLKHLDGMHLVLLFACSDPKSLKIWILFNSIQGWGGKKLYALAFQAWNIMNIWNLTCLRQQDPREDRSQAELQNGKGMELWSWWWLLLFWRNLEVCHAVAQTGAACRHLSIEFLLLNFGYDNFSLEKPAFFACEFQGCALSLKGGRFWQWHIGWQKCCFRWKELQICVLRLIWLLHAPVWHHFGYYVITCYNHTYIHILLIDHTS